MKIRIRKVLEDLQHDPTVADVLAGPVPAEADLLDAVRESGGDESVEKAAATFARSLEAIVDAYDGHLPERLRKEIADLAGLGQKPQPAAKPTAKAKPASPATPRPAAESIAALNRLAKLDQRANDAHALGDLERRAETIRKASGYTLSQPQAFKKALSDRPDLYERYRRHQLREMGYGDQPEALEKQEASAARLQRAAERIRHANPELTRVQAIERALREEPEAYSSGGPV